MTDLSHCYVRQDVEHVLGFDTIIDERLREKKGAVCVESRWKSPVPSWWLTGGEWSNGSRSQDLGQKWPVVDNCNLRESPLTSESSDIRA